MPPLSARILTLFQQQPDKPLSIRDIERAFPHEPRAAIMIAVHQLIADGKLEATAGRELRLVKIDY